MADHFAAELSKLLRRPASLILGLALLVGLAVFGYLFVYLTASGVRGGATPPGFPLGERIMRPALPENVPARVVSTMASLGAAVSLIFGALAAGGEYGWGTLKLVLSQRSGRLGPFCGKLLAVGAVLAAFCLLAFVVGGLCSVVAAGLLGQPANWPSFLELLGGLGAGWLILAAWASLGVFLAVLFRGASAAIAVGLLYAVVLEGLILTLPVRSRTLAVMGELLLGKNARDVVWFLRDVPGGALPPVVGFAGPTQAALIPAAYLVGFVLLAAFFFRRRDV